MAICCILWWLSLVRWQTHSYPCLFYLVTYLYLYSNLANVCTQDIKLRDTSGISKISIITSSIHRTPCGKTRKQKRTQRRLMEYRTTQDTSLPKVRWG
ncbi:hypothetical protein BDW59DRAFT_28750 [Aspergillus cavernicola]|uniref:Secreted protein n=1 Tax=Aspergillus cavernicola TaxID=176166 RepID=A0ABR4IQE2_9EURO